MSLGEPKEEGGKERAPAGQEEGARERGRQRRKTGNAAEASTHGEANSQRVKYSERKSGKSGVRARRDETQPAATGGRCGARGGGAARELPPTLPQGCVPAAVRKVGERAKGANGGGGCGEGCSEEPAGRHSPVPPAREGMGEGKWDELTSQGLTERR